MEISNILLQNCSPGEYFLIQFGSLLLAMEEQTEFPLNNMLTEPETNILEKTYKWQISTNR